jgi:hypothetical protein
MTVRQLLNSLDSREISEWMAYFSIENDGTDGKGDDLNNKLLNAFNFGGKGKK